MRRARRTRRRTHPWGWLFGAAVMVLVPASAHARAGPFSANPRSYATSIQVGGGHAWSRRSVHSSLHFGLGPKFYNGNWSGKDPNYGLYLHPSIGVRIERADLRRRYAEFALEAGVGPSVRDGSNTWTPVTLGYRIAGLAGTVDRPGRAPVYSTGLRHGPVLGMFAGVVLIDVSHEVITKPEIMQGLRLGISVELNPLIWLMTGIW